MKENAFRELLLRSFNVFNVKCEQAKEISRSTISRNLAICN
jgi:hypothetical protein